MKTSLSSTTYIYIYVYATDFVIFFSVSLARSAGADKYTDNTAAEG